MPKGSLQDKACHFDWSEAKWRNLIKQLKILNYGKKKSRIVAVVATLLIAAAGVITFEACNKKNEVIKSVPETMLNKGIVYQTEVPDREAYILEFEKKLQAGAKSDEALTAENANAFMFDILNFDFCNINGDGPDKTYETSTYTLNVSDGMISLSEFANLYSQISAHVYDYYHSLNLDNKNYYCIVPEIAEFDASATSTTVTVNTTLTSGQLLRDRSVDPCENITQDEYQWREAAEVLSDCFNMSIYHPNLSERVFFTCISYKHFDYIHYPQLFNCYGCNVTNHMISNEEMCIYLNSYLDLAEEYRPHIKNIIMGLVKAWNANPEIESSNDQTTLNHTLDVSYGIITATQIVVRL